MSDCVDYLANADYDAYKFGAVLNAMMRSVRQARDQTHLAPGDDDGCECDDQKEVGGKLVTAGSDLAQVPFNTLRTGLLARTRAGSRTSDSQPLARVEFREITRQSSTRLEPGWSLGKCGSIVAQASSDDQNSAMSGPP